MGDSSLSLGVGRTDTHSDSFAELEKRNMSQDIASHSPAWASFWKMLVYILGKLRYEILALPYTFSLCREGTDIGPSKV